MLESALYNILRAILGFIRVLFCYADKSSELCKVNCVIYDYWKR